MGWSIPGGESTTMLKLLRRRIACTSRCGEFGRTEADFRDLRGRDSAGTRSDNPEQESLGLVDIAVERNAYGRQIDSRVVRISLEGSGARRAGSGVHPRADHPANGAGSPRAGEVHGDPVLIEEGRHLVATFHPELTGDRRLQRLFLQRL